MTQLPERLRLDLTDSLTGDVKFLSDLLEGSGSSVIETEAEPENLLFPLGQRSKHLFQLLLQHREGSRVRGHRNIIVLNEVSQVAVLFLADRGLERYRLL